MLHKVSEYTMIESKGVSLLSNKVNAAMKDGWVPSGTPIVADGHIYQAMVKFEN